MTTGSSSGIELTILMPCLNEARTLETCLGKARQFIAQSSISAEIVVADNGSTDGSQEISRRAGARVVDVAVRGYGAAIYWGSKAALGRFIVVGDADDSYDFLALAPFVDKLREGYDLVIGDRFSGGILPGAMPWKNRYVGNPVLSGIARLFFRCPVRDLHCGLRAYTKDAFERLDLRTTGMEFATEMVMKATLLGMRIAEVPTTLRPDGRDRAPHLRPWRDGWRHLRFMLVYSPRWLFLYPGLFLTAASGLLGAWVAASPRRVGGVELDVHSLLYAGMMFLGGFQAIAFSIFSKVFALQEGLLPPDRRLERLFRWITLEVGLSVGIALVLLGVGGTIAAVASWGETSFGPLDPREKMRLVIPSAVALTLGIEIVLSSFFLSVLGLKIRRLEDPR